MEDTLDLWKDYFQLGLHFDILQQFVLLNSIGLYFDILRQNNAMRHLSNCRIINSTSITEVLSALKLSKSEIYYPMLNDIDFMHLYITQKWRANNDQ